MNRRTAARALCLAALPLLLQAPAVLASCGANVCSVNNEWDTQGVWTEPGLRLDARIEATDADRLLSGSDKTAAAGTPGTTDETRTRNRNLLLGADYSLSPDWSMSVQLPLIRREHTHTVNNPGPTVESWNIGGPGDIRASLRRLFTIDDRTTLSLHAGAKLPTGSTDETNASGVVAERALQPGTGTADAMAGLTLRYRLRNESTTVFFGTRGEAPLHEHDGFAPGRQIHLDLGIHHALGFTSSALLQINVLDKSHDRGINAEPAETGGRYVFLSPGFRQSISHNGQLYGFLQVPLYQYVNGTQLATSRALVLGVSWRM